MQGRGLGLGGQAALRKSCRPEVPHMRATAAAPPLPGPGLAPASTSVAQLSQGGLGFWQLFAKPDQTSLLQLGTPRALCVLVLCCASPCRHRGPRGAAQAAAHRAHQVAPRQIHLQVWAAAGGGRPGASAAASQRGVTAAQRHQRGHPAGGGLMPRAATAPHVHHSTGLCSNVCGWPVVCLKLCLQKAVRDNRTAAN